MAGTSDSDISRVLVNGEAQPCPGVRDRGLHYGDGLFETMAIDAGRVVAAEDHLQRLATGMERLGITGLDLDVLRGEMAELARDVSQAVLKLVVTRGEGGRGYQPPEIAAPARILIRYPWPAQPAGAAREGVRVRSCETRLGRNPQLAGIKHLNRLEQVMARREWSDPDIVEGLMFDEKDLLIEGVSSNVFLHTGDALLTPRLHRCGVRGIIRQSLAKIATISSMQLIEKDIDRATLHASLAAGAGLFLTNSLIGLWPVRELDGRSLPIPDAVHRLRDALMHQRGLA